MANLRVRFKLNPGRNGVLLGKMSKQTENIELFLRALASDLGLDVGRNEWLADHFKSGSLEETITLPFDVPEEKIVNFNEAISYLSKFTQKNPAPKFLGAATVDSFADLRQCLDPDERIGVGIIDLNGKSKPFVFVDRTRLEEVSKSIETETRYVGAVIGHTHEWNKGADKPYIVIRDLNSSELVRCNYSDGDYAQVAKLFAKKTAVVVVEGTISLNLITSKTEVLLATGFDFAPDFSDEDFNKFFGAAPNLTGKLTSEEFVAKGRSDGH